MQIGKICGEMKCQLGEEVKCIGDCGPDTDKEYGLEEVTQESYNYIHKPKHYQLFTVDDLRRLVAEGKGIDVVTIANKSGLNKDAYMFNVLKYVLRKGKPNEPRDRDVQKIKEYSEIWLENYAEECPLKDPFRSK